MLPTLRAFQADARLSLGLIVTGMHLSDRFGMTVSELRKGLPITRILDCDSSSCAAMASNIGYLLIEIVKVLQAQRPDSLGWRSRGDACWSNCCCPSWCSYCSYTWW